MKPPATQAAREVRAKLQALAARGVGGEAESAARKLARLEARYDWSAPCQQAKGDIFAGIAFCRSSTARPLAMFTQAESDIASYVQWAIQSAAGVNGLLRTSPDWKLSVWMEAEAHAMPRLSSIAETIRRSFADLWARFSATPGVQPAARKVFFEGLYCGMMGDERKPGERLPPVVAPKTKPVKGRRKLALAPGVAIHPYTLAVELGRSIRLSVPIGEIVESLTGRIEALAA